jgi:deoxyribose-phosphate aldolase
MNLAAYIDHTLLKPTATNSEIEKLCQEAISYNFKAVCVPPAYVLTCKNILKNTNIQLATVIGFPFGYNNIAIKLAEAGLAINQGANELDMVINIAALKNNNFAYLEEEISQISSFTQKNNICLKIIIESGILTNNEIEQCCFLYNQYPIQFLKTSTGYAAQGATLEAVNLFKSLLNNKIQIKASGGIKTKEAALAFIQAGATRIGTSSGIEIVK